jgi:hypothetical protein
MNKQSDESTAAAILGRKGGQSKSPAKATASRANGGAKKNLRAENVPGCHRIRGPWYFSCKTSVVWWLIRSFPDHQWTARWSLSRLDTEMRDVELTLCWD